MAPSTFSLSLFAPFLRRSKKYKKLETDEPEKKKQDEVPAPTMSTRWSGNLSCQMGRTPGLAPTKAEER